MKSHPTAPLVVLIAGVFACLVPPIWSFQPPASAPLPKLDRRNAHAAEPGPTAERALAKLRERLPDLKVAFDDVIGSPKSISVPNGFLSGPDGRGKAISEATANAVGQGASHFALKAFLTEHRDLFGHGAEALNDARIKREFITTSSGLKTVVWEQQVDNVPLFESVLISHTTRRGELVNIASHFIPLPTAAAERGHPNRKALLTAPPITSEEALRLAAENLGAAARGKEVTTTSPAEGTPEKRQKFSAPFLRGEGEAKLTWLPMDKGTLRLCWDLLLTVRERAELYRVLVDAETGELIVRRCLTDYLTNATYRVFGGDSPSPLSPGHSTPLTNQPPLGTRSLIALSALDTNASPAGWVPDLANETLGNNVDAHTDLNNDNLPDLPRPAGSPFRVFDFPMDLTQPPSTYRPASVLQLFYLCNWMHDKLYQLGFTEEAGNFQNNNFGRGGLGNDALQADAQDGSGVDNANMSTPPDGSAPRMQMFVFSGATPDRDSSFDTEIVIHEYIHGLSNRRVGGGVGLSTLQSQGMGEGWSDWYALTMLSDAGDDLNGNFAAGGYSTFQFGSSTNHQNYYFGIRRYPYSTDLSKNPLTFRDIDPGQASTHPDVPRNQVITAPANEVHAQGEVWCVTLWEARANLITKYGFSQGNELIAQLVTDGMNLSPVNPNFLQARDAIIQADLVLTGGANRHELWAAFAKRGMGAGATSPSSFTTVGVRESFDLPDDLTITPAAGFTSRGLVGGPFNPMTASFTFTNSGASALHWTLVHTAAWLNVSPAGGTLTPGGPATLVQATLNGLAATLPPGIHSSSVRITNLNSGIGAERSFVLRVGQQLDDFTEMFESGDNDLAFKSFTFSPNGGPGFYTPCRTAATSFFTDPAGGTTLSLGDDNFSQITLSGTNTVSIYGKRTNVVFICGNGYLTMDSGDFNYVESFESHFSLPRVAALYHDLNPGAGGTVSWKQTADRLAVTFSNVPKFGSSAVVNFQTEMFFDGRIRITYLAIGITRGLAGLSAGQGLPGAFRESDFSSYGACGPRLVVTVPSATTEDAGLIAGQAYVGVSSALATNLIVSLASSDPTVVTVPPSVLIPAGQTNAAFDLTIVDDALLDATHEAVIMAWALGLGTNATSIAVHDNETAILQVSLPASVIEGGVTQGVITVSAPPAANAAVLLASSDLTELIISSPVVIPVGQTSAVFTVMIPDDALIDGPQSVTVTAQVENWMAGVTSLTVFDNDGLDLLVTLPASVLESAGTLTNAGSVQLPGTLATNLVVFLVFSNAALATVPTMITIPAGQVIAPFDLTLMDDLLVNGSRSAFLTASASGFANGGASMAVLDDEDPPMPTNPLPSDLATNIAANTDLAWDNGRPGITNDVYFGQNPVPGLAEFMGSTTGGAWDLPLLAPATTYYWQIVARHIGATPGPVWRFTTRGADHLEWSSVTSPQFVGIPFPVTITARDEFGTAVNNFTGAVALTGLSGGQITNTLLPSPAPDDLGSGNYTLGYSFTPNTNLTIIAVRHYFGTKVSIWTDTGLLLVAQPVSSIPGTWTETELANPLQLSAGSRYRIATYTGGGLYYSGKNPGGTFANGTIDQGCEGAGDVFPGNSVSLSQWLVDFRYTVGSSAPVAITPAGADAFTNGVWTGHLTVLHHAASVSLTAAHGAGQHGTSNPFDVSFANDLSVTIASHPAAAVMGELLTNIITVFNSGPAAATEVAVTNFLPPSVAFLSATSSHGSCVLVDDRVECGLGTLSGGASATLTVVSTVNATGLITNRVTIGRAEADTYAGNNTAEAVMGAPIHFTWSEVPSLQLTNGSFTVILQAHDYLGRVLTNYQGSVNFTGVSSRGLPVSPEPAVSGDFTNGLWAGSLRIASPATNVVLTADDGSGHTGRSNPFHVVRSGQALVIMAQPRPQTLNLGMPATFSVDAYAAASPPLTYQWRRNGANIVNGGRISGANGRVLRISNVLVADAGNYSVVIGGPGSATSASATLSINPADHFTWSPIAPFQGTNLAFPVTITARTSLDQIATNFTGTVLLSASAGSAPVGLTRTLSDHFVDGVWSGSLRVTQIASNVILRAEDGLGNFALATPINVLERAPLTFTLQPTNQNVLPGTNVTLVAQAVGTGLVRYQWSFEGTNIANATNASFSFSNAALDNSHGNFSVVAMDDLGTAVSSNAFVYVLVRPVVILQPLAQQVVQGERAMVVCVATGAPPIIYRWLINGVPVVTNTSGIFVSTNLQNSLVVRASARNDAGNVNSSSVNLTVLRDFDGDRMADSWETNYFGFSTNNAADGLLDFDGDGMSNRDEFAAGTDPSNALSLLKLFVSESNVNVLEFVAQTNKTYTLLCRTNLTDGPWTTVTNIFPATSVRTIQVNSAGSALPSPARFYRVTTPLIP